MHSGAVMRRDDQRPWPPFTKQSVERMRRKTRPRARRIDMGVWIERRNPRELEDGDGILVDFRRGLVTNFVRIWRSGRRGVYDGERCRK